MEPTDQTALTVLDQYAMELMDLTMDQPEPHAPLKSQLLFHTITLTHLPETHTPIQEIHSQLAHTTFQELPTQTPTSEDNPMLKLQLPDIQNQKRYFPWTQRSPELTPPFTDNTERNKKWKIEKNNLN